MINLVENVEASPPLLSKNFSFFSQKHFIIYVKSKKIIPKLVSEMPMIAF